MFEAVNLDDLSTDPHDLREAAEVLGRLSAYAYAKAQAMELRNGGKVAEALRVEKLLEITYATLPEWARW